MTPQLLGNVKKPTGIDISHLVIEDDQPVDNMQSAQQQRLLVEPLYSSPSLPGSFLVEANVGVFYELKEDPIVPDIFLSLGVQRPADYTLKENRSYFVWEFGKLPELCIEIVSNQEGDEINLSRRSKRKGKTVSKKDRYAKIGIQYYVVFDQLKKIQADMNDSQVQVWGNNESREMILVRSMNDVGEFIWLSDIGIGLALWHGAFEGETPSIWLRWCDRSGTVIPTGAERAKRAELLAENERFRAESERFRAENERSRAENAEVKARQLADRLRELGIDPDNV